MRIGIVGCGGIALGYAAMLTQEGHDVVLWSPSGKGGEGLHGAEIEVSGILDMRFRPVMAWDAQVLIDHAEVVIIAVPGYGHKAVIDAIVPFAKNGQTFIVSAELSLSATYLSQRLLARGVTAEVVAWATTALMSRRSGPLSVSIGGIRTKLEAAVLPAGSDGSAIDICRDLFGERFTEVPDIMAIALSNLNPPIHLASALCNFTRIEKAEYWANYDGITPSVARMIEALDAERLDVAKAYGVKVRTVHDHYHLTFGFEPGMTLADMAAAVHEKRKGPPGPVTTDTRFITEDVPFGIVPVIALAERRGVVVPLHKAGLVVVNALYGRNFENANDLLSYVT
ncbi:NAD(P)-binding domain-containing protein [Rhizobium sp. CG5]|uniref:NAD/NADP octopine/nopaline dehydrogenase family protein n=1 Tax=Rhizobium sp. CG5 TaxID=2726076 RepID=UPI002033C07A|nr:NAD/NADP octopine/nopaline dehydrogenase family protein [Rhizobium sp. CG5]MCM2474551.1 NAD(P)-binding domain-containing protein [Rhizobium sp. CG5]